MPTLFDLPREIRDQIYDVIFSTQSPFQMVVPNDPSPPPGQRTSLWANTVFSIAYTPPDIYQTQVRDHQRPHGLQWVLANKQICSEAIEQFQRTAIWTIIDTEFIPQRFPDVVCLAGITGPWNQAKEEDKGMKGRWTNPKPNPTTHHSDSLGKAAGRGGPCLLTPSASHHLSVQMQLFISSYRNVDDVEDDGTFDKKPVFAINTSPRANKATHAMVSELAEAQKLRTLSVFLRPIISQTNLRKRIPFRGELGQLRQLRAPDLRKVEFRVYCVDEEFRCGQHFIDALGGVIKGIGRGLLGGEAVAVAHNMDHDAGHLVAVYTYTRS